jgi:hypothetical protein
MAAFEHEGSEYRIVGGQVETRLVGARGWQQASLQWLLREYAVDSPLWDWLRENGIRRPSPSGVSVEEDRSKVQRKLRLDPRDDAALETLARARGMTMSDLVAQWIRRDMQQFDDEAIKRSRRR